MAVGPVELFTDCTSCGLEAGRVETYDPLAAACRFGLPARTQCKLCGERWLARVDRAAARELAQVEAHQCPVCLAHLPEAALDDHRCPSCTARAILEKTHHGIVFDDRTAVEIALDAWAAREGYAERDAFLTATFREPSVDLVAQRLLAREPVEVLADPFATFGARRRDHGSQTSLEASATAAPTSLPPPSAPPRAIVFPLVSVIAADGEIHPSERTLVDRFLVSEGLAPLHDDEFRVHHPSAVAHLIPPHRREAIVQLMCETAAIDGLPDESERRVIRAYAAAWRVPEEKVDFWIWGYENMNTSLVRQLWLKIRRFVLSARWNNEPREDV